MSGLLERAAALFLAPPDERRGSPPALAAVAARPFAPAAIVLGAPADALSVAWLLAAELRLRAGGGCVLLGEWRGGGSPSPPAGVAHPTTRRLAARLAARGLEGSARARVLHLPLPAEPSAMAAAWRRAVAAAGAPAVCAVGGARPGAFDPLLDDHDLVVLAPPADATETLTDLAVSALAWVRPPVVLGRPVPRGAARLLAASSIATSRSLGHGVTDAVRRLA